MSGLFDSWSWRSDMNAPQPDLKDAPYPYATDAFYVNPPSKSEKPAELRAAPPTAYPSTSFWNNVTEDPAWQKKIGTAQAAALSAINSLGFGMPMALSKRFAPDEAEGVRKFLDQNGNASTAGAVAGAIANPANGVFRAAGNALANRGSGVASQAVADGLTMGGIFSAPGIVSGDGLTTPPEAITAAMANRFMMPALSPSVVQRVLTGVGAGGLSSAPSAIYNRNLEELGAGMAIGGLAGGLPRRTAFDEKNYSKEAAEKARDSYVKWALPGAAAATGVNAYSLFE